MMSVVCTNFAGTLVPDTPTTFTVRCLSCNQVVLSGFGDVDTDAVPHTCDDTTSTIREYEISWETKHDEVTVDDADHR